MAISPSIRMYVDENGNANLREDLSNPSNRFLCLTGVMMPITEHDVLTNALNTLKVKFFGSSDIVLHRREIISAKSPFESLNDSAVRMSFNNDLLNIIRTSRYKIISVVIDKEVLVDNYGIIRAYDPYSLALEYLMQRYQYWMQDYARKYGHVYGDILAESRGKREDCVTKTTYTTIYNGGGYHPLNDAPKFYSTKEIKLKKKSCNIAGLQFVDLISHPARRFILSSYNLAPNIKKSSFEQDVVDILVAKKFRRGLDGEILGMGAVLFPKQ